MLCKHFNTLVYIETKWRQHKQLLCLNTFTIYYFKIMSFTFAVLIVEQLFFKFKNNCSIQTFGKFIKKYV